MTRQKENKKHSEAAGAVGEFRSMSRLLPWVGVLVPVAVLSRLTAGVGVGVVKALPAGKCRCRKVCRGKADHDLMDWLLPEYQRRKPSEK